MLTSAQAEGTTRRVVGLFTRNAFGILLGLVIWAGRMGCGVRSVMGRT